MVPIASRVRSPGASTRVVLVLVVTLAVVISAIHSLVVDRSPEAAVVSLLIAAAVLASARYRGIALMLGVAVFVGQLLLETDFTVAMLGLSVVYLSVGLDGGRRQRALGAASVVLIVALALLTVYYQGVGPYIDDVLDLVGLPPWLVVVLGVLLGASVFVIPMLVGTLWQARHVVGQSVRELDRAEADREVLRLQAAVLGERARLAREVHDTVGHALTIVIAQSRVIQRLVDRDPQRATSAAATITAVAGDALAEIRGVLAGEDSETGLSRQDMVDLIAAVGLHERIEAEIDVDLPGLPPPAAGVARRVIQELLTNALRHGEDGAPIHVRGAAENDHVVILVTSVLPAAPRNGEATSGSGLRGLGERLAAIGGTLQAAPAAGRWRSEAHIPLDLRTAAPAGSETSEDNA